MRRAYAGFSEDDFFGLVVGLLSCTSGSGAESAAGLNVRNAKPGAGSSLVVGDSLAAGVGATDWHVIPAGCLDDHFAETAFDLSKPGLTSEQILATIPDPLPSAHLIFVSAGGNDALFDRFRPGSYPVEKSMAVMSKLFDKLLSGNAVVVYLGLNPPIAGAERLLQISDLAREKGILVVDGMAGMWADKTLMSDQVHPNDKGYAILCQRLLESVAPFYP